MGITATNLGWKIGHKTIVDNVSLHVKPGQSVGLLGPNGSGKSSLLRLLSGLKKPHCGEVSIGGRAIARQSRREVAQQVAFVQQHAATDAQISVWDAVRLGRTPHRSALAAWSEEDQLAVRSALARVNLLGKEHQSWHSLSGGERQRVQIARALAQKPSVLFLDEPTNHLDIQHQLELLNLVRELETTNVIALHDLNLAAKYCDHLIVMSQGAVVASGTPEEVLTDKLLRRVFRVHVSVEPSPFHHQPMIHFHSAVPTKDPGGCSTP